MVKSLGSTRFRTGLTCTAAGILLARIRLSGYVSRASKFEHFILKLNFAISHIIPGYALPLSDEMIKQAIGKTEEEIDLAIIDWKGLGNSDMRQQAISVLDKLHIRYERTSEVGKHD